MQFLLSLIICNILAVASCNLGFFKKKVTDVKIMEELLDVLNSEKQSADACQNLYTIVHWAFWFESFVTTNDGNTKESQKYAKEKCTKNCCQKLQNFLKEKANDEREDEFKQFLENVIKNIESPEIIRYEELLEQFKIQKKFEIEIAEEIYSLKKLEEAKKKKFEKIKEKDGIEKLYKAENKKVEDMVEAIKKKLRDMYSLFNSIGECEKLKENGQNEFEKRRNELLRKINEFEGNGKQDENIAQNLQTLADTAREIHEKFNLETNDHVENELNEKIKSAKEAVQKIGEASKTEKHVNFYDYPEPSYHREMDIPFGRSENYFVSHFDSSYDSDDDRRSYHDYNRLKSKADNLLYDINYLVKLKKKMCECPAKLEKEKKEFEEKREELGKEIHSFPMQLKKETFYTECLPIQPEIESLHKMAVEEFEAGIALENKDFYESKYKLEGIYNSLMDIAKNAIASTFGHNCQFFEAAQKYLKKSILATYFTVKQRKEKRTILENLKEYSMEKHLLWREMYGSFGNCHIGMYEKIEENFKNEIKNLVKNSNDEEEFHALITRSLRRELFKELGINQQNEIKIRMTDVHAHINVGDFDYDYRQYEPPRRLLFRYDIDAKTKENSPRKAKPMKIPENQNGMKKYFTVEEADNVFFQLNKNGWNQPNYSHAKRRVCVGFAYEFVCNLHAQNCPAKEVWPDNYLSVAENSSLGSVFGSDYESIHRDFQEEFNKTNKFEKCTIEDFHLQFEIDTAEVVEKTKLDILFPPTIYYVMGKHYSTTKYQKVTLDDLIEVQELVQLDNEKSQGNKIVYKTVLKAYACRVDYKLHAFIKNLKIVQKGRNGDAYPLFEVAHLDIYEDNRELLHFKLKERKVQLHVIL